MPLASEAHLRRRACVRAVQTLSDFVRELVPGVTSMPSNTVGLRVLACLEHECFSFSSNGVPRT